MPPSTAHNNMNAVTGVILAGGRASRMGGKDKGLLILNERPLISHVLDRFATLQQVVISANRNITQYAEFGRPVISDNMDNFPGPLAGMLAALESIDTPYLLTAPCDTPLIPEFYIKRMLAVIDTHPGMPAVASDGKWLQPVFSLLPVQLSASLRQYLQSGERRTSAWLHSIGAIEVDFSDCPNMFVNINAPEELQAQEKQWPELQR